MRIAEKITDTELLLLGYEIDVKYNKKRIEYLFKAIYPRIKQSISKRVKNSNTSTNQELTIQDQQYIIEKDLRKIVECDLDLILSDYEEITNYDSYVNIKTISESWDSQLHNNHSSIEVDIVLYTCTSYKCEIALKYEISLIHPLRPDENIH